MTRARLSPAAIKDVREIRTYSKAIFGSDAAKAYIEGLRRSFSFLRGRPFAGVEEHRLPGNLRGFSHSSHRSYYRAEADGILIVRVLHHARDLGNVLGTMP